VGRNYCRPQDPRAQPMCNELFDRCLSILELGRELLQDGVFKRLGRTQPNNRLGLDFNLLAGLRITAKARLAMCLYYAADIGDNKFPGGALCFSHCEFEQLFKELYCGLF